MVDDNRSELETAEERWYELQAFQEQYWGGLSMIAKMRKNMKKSILARRMILILKRMVLSLTLHKIFTACDSDGEVMAYFTREYIENSSDLVFYQ